MFGSPSSSANERPQDSWAPALFSGWAAAPPGRFWGAPALPHVVSGFLGEGATTRLGLASGAVGGQAPGLVPQGRDVTGRRPGCWARALVPRAQAGVLPCGVGAGSLSGDSEAGPGGLRIGQLACSEEF